MSNTQQAAAGATIPTQAGGETEVEGYNFFTGIIVGVVANAVSDAVKADQAPTFVTNGFMNVLNNGGYVVPK
jgi:hypothetical protein